MIKKTIEDTVRDFGGLHEQQVAELTDRIADAIAPELEESLRTSMWAGIHLARTVDENYPEAQP